MTVLVTGGAGFIGSHLVERLLGEGHRVVAVDNLRRGSEANLRQFIQHQGLSFVIGDLRDQAVLDGIADRGPFDVVYHLAAIHYIPECVAHPLETLSVNVLATQALLDTLDCRQFVFASTADVYAGKEGPLSESDAIAPSNVYGLSKATCEALLRLAIDQRPDTHVLIARLFNVYGPRETNPHIIPRLLEEASHDRAVRLGNLWPRRDFTYVADTVDALLALAALEECKAPGIFNVGTGVATSVADLVELLGGILGTTLKVEVEASQARKRDRAHLQADTSKLRAATGWLPRYSLEEGLKRVCRAQGLLH